MNMLDKIERERARKSKIDEKVHDALERRCHLAEQITMMDGRLALKARELARAVIDPSWITKEARIQLACSILDTVDTIEITTDIDRTS